MSLSQKDLQLEGSFCISNATLISEAIAEGIRCKNWSTLPRKADMIIEKIEEVCAKEFEKVTDSFYWRAFADYDALFDWLREHILPIPEIQAMNLTQAEHDAKVELDDPSRPQFVFISRYSPDRAKDDDFVDIDAYIRNLCHNLIRECIQIDFSSFISRKNLTGIGPEIDIGEQDE